MNYHHAMRINHPAFDFGHSGITFEVSPDESVWFSVERFVEESEYITLQGLPESTEGTVFARIGPIGWFEFTGI